MSENKNIIQIYDDSVLKMTIKQGDEKYRFNKEDIDENGNISSTGLNVLDKEGAITTQTNAFNSGELIYSRDTNRVFVGNFSPKLAENQQQTLGGVLVGNKYLGYVDSKPDITTDKISSGNPLELSSTDGKSGLLEANSPYRAHDWIDKKDEDKKCIRTRDGHWKRESFYNSKYDAYDGDYAYDIYRNALILFDSRIKPTSDDKNPPGLTTPATGKKRKTILKPWTCDKIDNADTNEFSDSVERYTSDMYGDGYVLLYNVIPDGETITFMEKTFNGKHSDYKKEDQGKTNGLPVGTTDNSKKPFNSSENYSYNILRIGKIRYESIEHIFKNDYFIKSTDYIVPRMTHLLYGESTNIGANTTTYTASRDMYYTAVLVGTGAKATVNINGYLVFEETLSNNQKITINYPLIQNSTIEITNCTVSSSRYIPYKNV